MLTSHKAIHAKTCILGVFCKTQSKSKLFFVNSGLLITHYAWVRALTGCAALLLLVLFVQGDMCTVSFA